MPARTLAVVLTLTLAGPAAAQPDARGGVEPDDLDVGAAGGWRC